MDNYADRKPELTKLRKELNCNQNAIFIMAGKAFGITSFLKEKAQVYFGHSPKVDQLVHKGLQNIMIDNPIP